jgi:hypothetical protein
MVLAGAPWDNLGMFQKILDAVDRNRTWKTYRHCLALVNLLKVLGVWPKVVAGAALIVGPLVGYLVVLPLWGRMIVGLGVAALLSMTVLAIVTAATVPNPQTGQKLLPRRSIMVAICCVVGMAALGWWLFNHNQGPPLSRMLSNEEAEVLRLVHENTLLKYGTYQKDLARIYGESNRVTRDACRVFNISDEQIESDCRVDLAKGTVSLVLAPAQQDGCFGYDPRTLYATNRIQTIFSAGKYTILDERNWPVAFASEEGAQAFLGVARSYRRMCFVGGVGRPSMSDVLIEWPTAKDTSSVGLCENFAPDHLTILEDKEAAFVVEGGKRLLRFTRASEASAAVKMARGHSALCVIGGLPGINAPDHNVIGWESVTGDRVVCLN